FTSCSLFFNDTSTTEPYPLSLHDALPIWTRVGDCPYHVRACPDGVPDVDAQSHSAIHVAHVFQCVIRGREPCVFRAVVVDRRMRSEEHTSELQSRGHLVCRLLLEKKKKCL